MPATKHFPEVKTRRWYDTRFIAIMDIPEPQRSEFRDWIKGQAMPVIFGLHGGAYASDWKRFVEHGQHFAH